MKIGGKELTREEVLRLVGRIEQLGGAKHFEFTDGPARGMRGISVNTGELSFTVLPDRGMDIGAATYHGINLAYQTCSGEVAPQFYEPEGIGWLRTFGAGLLTTCGLSNFGPPGLDGEEGLGLHGRYSTSPARQVNDLSRWEGDEYVIELSAVVEECRLFGCRLRNARRIRTAIGSGKIEIIDQVENFGYESSPLCLLYHMNLGYPLLSEKSVLEVKGTPTARDAKDVDSAETAKRFQQPTPGYAEQVFTYNVAESYPAGEMTARLRNPDLGLTFSVKTDTSMLPYLTEWKMMGQGEYVLGIEPGTAPVLHRAELRDKGLLQQIEPDEKKTFRLEIQISPE